MVTVFIGYGGARAESVADLLNSFLRIELVDSFCASPQSNQLPEGQTANERKQFIRQKMEESEIIVLVCHSESPDSDEFKDEIKYIIERKLNNKVVMFSKCDDCIPDIANDLWHPLHFAPEKAVESFGRLLNQIFRAYINLYRPAEIRKGGV